MGSVGEIDDAEMWTVWSSIFLTFLSLTAAAKLEGLLGTFGARSKVNTTSSAVNGEPSCQVTPLRSLNSHVASSSTFQLSASPGLRRCCSSGSISRSNTWLRMELLGARLW